MSGRLHKVWAVPLLLLPLLLGAAESAAREAGLSAERAKDIREKVLGVRPKQS